MSLRAPVIFVCALLAGAWPRISDACECIAPGYTSFLAPADGATEVPRNADVWVGAGRLRSELGSEDLLPVELVDEAGDPVETTRHSLANAMDEFVILAPRKPLEAGATYVVKSKERVLSTFRTGNSTLETPPAVPAEVSRSANIAPDGHSSACEPAMEIRFTFAGDPFLLVLDREGEARIDAGPDGSASGFAPGATAWIGHSLCGGTWPGTQGEHSHVRFGAFDVAGHFSGWSDYTEVVLDDDGRPGSAGCTAQPAGMTGLFALLALRRPRRRLSTR